MQSSPQVGSGVQLPLLMLLCVFMLFSPQVGGRLPQPLPATVLLLRSCRLHAVCPTTWQPVAAVYMS
jgi:hypothetical protein